MPPKPAAQDENNTVLFSTSKKETFTLTNGLKTLQRKLKSNWKLATLVRHRLSHRCSLDRSIKDEITLDKLLPARMVVFAGPRDKFTAAEFDAIKNYISSGGAVLVLLGEGGETRFDTNINFLLEEYGIVVNAGLIQWLGSV